ncbi:MAG TPA: (Fe-S)-binding protein [Saprospiraceae bacterium]|nr:(Fe-S)-binding protein [Saprospiraceae bacterium]
MQQIIFLLLIAGVSYLGYTRYVRVYQNIQLGKAYSPSGSVAERMKNVVLIALGQKKMFKNFIPAIFHFFIYAAFLLTQVELIEIILDGITGNHRLFANSLGGLYTLIINLIEILSFLALIATFVFLYRRNLLKVPRLVKSELNGWPKLDANYILLGELLLVGAIFTMNGADVILQELQPSHYPETGPLALSSWLGPLLFGGFSEQSLVVLERVGWWAHILVVFGFILYLPVSKHLHIFLAFPNVYFTGVKPRGEMTNMPEIMMEVKSMFGLVEGAEADVNAELPQFGAKDIPDLSWKNILDAYSCTECGRCTAACPANITGKKLSPRKIMMDVRDRAETIGKGLETQKITIDQYDDGKSLFDLISPEELHACTTCNACVEECPILINPLDIILQMRRYEILTNAAGPADWTPMFTSLENSGSVWQVPVARDAWRD